LVLSFGILPYQFEVYYSKSSIKPYKKRMWKDLFTQISPHSL